MKVKIGQIIKFQKDHYIALEKGGKALVKKGDTARVLKKIDETTGEIVYLTGEARDKCQYVKLEVDDNLDADAIAKQILRGMGQ